MGVARTYLKPMLRSKANLSGIGVPGSDRHPVRRGFRLADLRDARSPSYVPLVDSVQL
jgi:hypothetical protein